MTYSYLSPHQSLYDSLGEYTAVVDHSILGGEWLRTPFFITKQVLI